MCAMNPALIHLRSGMFRRAPCMAAEQTADSGPRADNDRSDSAICAILGQALAAVVRAAS
jgi:hypothetical protein